MARLLPFRSPDSARLAESSDRTGGDFTVSSVLWAIVTGVLVVWIIVKFYVDRTQSPLGRSGIMSLSTILWTIIVLLLIFWLVGLVASNLGTIAWVALVIAIVLLVYNLITRGRATV